MLLRFWLTAGLFCLTACTVQHAGPVVWDFAPRAIQIRYQADEMLNTYNERAHTLVMVVYQLSSSEVFNDLSKNSKGLSRLLSADRFDPSIMSVDKVIVQPGEVDTLFINRSENARWIGIVTGYYGLDPGKVDCKFQFSHSITRKGWIRRKRFDNVDPILIDMTLGPKSIDKVGKI